MALKIESKLFSGYFVSVSKTITKVMHMQVAIHLHNILLRCNLRSRFFLTLLLYSKKKKKEKKISVFSQSISRDEGWNDKQGWGGIAVVLLLNVKPQCQVAKAA